MKVATEIDYNEPIYVSTQGFGERSSRFKKIQSIK